jgi:hypothetical protein
MSNKVQRIIDYETAYGNVDQWSENEKNNVARILNITTEKLNNFIKRIIFFRISEDQFSNNPIVLSDEEEKKLLKPYNISKQSKKRKREIGGSRSHKRKNKRSNKFRKN